MWQAYKAGSKAEDRSCIQPQAVQVESVLLSKSLCEARVLVKNQPGVGEGRIGENRMLEERVVGRW